MAKKILFVFPSMGIGGTTVSTRNLISLLGKEGYDCLVMPLNQQGLLIHLYDDVKQVKTPFFVRVLSVSGWKEMPSFSQKLAAAVFRFLCKNCKSYERRIIGKCFDNIIRKYNIDTVVACQEAITTRLVSYAGIKSKVAWIRCDYRRRMEEMNTGREVFYESFKAIVCVSDKTCEDFKAIYPEYAAKTYSIPNPQDGGLMARRADEEEQEPRFTTDDITIVSVGRFDAVKRFDQIAPIARQLKDKGLRFHWYLIGEGIERGHIEASIKEFVVEKEVIMLGVKANPYYYIKRADVLVCLSRSEACPRVVNEAKILHTPTISTDFPTIYEFINDGETGIITSLYVMPDAIMRLLTDNELLKRIKTNIGLFEFDNTALMEQIESFL